MADIKIGKMTIGSVQTNCYFLYREDAKEVIVVDPADYGDYIYQTLKKNGFEVKGIFLTHGHFDHIWGAQQLRGLSGAKIYALDAEEKLLLDSELNVSAMAGRACTLKANQLLKDGEELTIADVPIRVIATPGHTAGGCCYYVEEAGILVCGDTLFQGSVGRTDLPTGSMSTLVRSLKEKILVLPEDVRCYPGHGESTTVGYEKIHNPFI